MVLTLSGQFVSLTGTGKAVRVFYPEVFEKSSNVKFHESPSITSQVVPCGWTDGEDRRDEANIIFVILANVPKMTNLHFY